jgi:LysM repeat protein
MILVMSKVGQLSDEFKKEVKESGSKKNILGTVTALIAIVLVFGTIGIATYELIFKPDKIQQKSADEKIESRPEAQVETPTTGTTTPSATATSTPAPAITTPPTTTTQPTYTNYTVVTGDTYSSIANANNLSSASLMQYNNTTSEDLQIGQVIKIPKQ